MFKRIPLRYFTLLPIAAIVLEFIFQILHRYNATIHSIVIPYWRILYFALFELLFIGYYVYSGVRGPIKHASFGALLVNGLLMFSLLFQMVVSVLFYFISLQILVYLVMFVFRVLKQIYNYIFMIPLLVFFAGILLYTKKTCLSSMPARRY